MDGQLCPLIPFLPGRLKFMDRVTIQDAGTGLAILTSRGESLSESSMREIGHCPQGGPSSSMSGMWKRSRVADLRAPAIESVGNRRSQSLNHRATSRLYPVSSVVCRTLE